MVAIDDYSGTRRVHVGGQFPSLPYVPSDLNINRVLQTDVVQSIIVYAVAAIVFLHTGCLQNWGLFKTVSALS